MKTHIKNILWAIFAVFLLASFAGAADDHRKPSAKSDAIVVSPEEMMRFQDLFTAQQAATAKEQKVSRYWYDKYKALHDCLDKQTKDGGQEPRLCLGDQYI